MATTAESVIARVPQWAGRPDLQVSPLGGGITNQNYKVVVGGEAFVLRISGANTDLLGINREHEHAANVAAAAAGVAPEVVAFLRPEGYLITRFLEARPVSVEQIGQPDTIRRVVEALRRIHSMGTIPGSFSAFRVVESYAGIGRRYQVPLPDNFEWLLARKQEVEQAFARRAIPPSPCHNDLLNANFLDDGRIRVLDWEYAGMGDIFFDLANFAVNHDFDDGQDRFLLECYFGTASAGAQARLRLMKAMSDFREAMWGIVQIGISQLDFDFPAYADKHFARMTERMQNPNWQGWLKEAAHDG